MAKEYLGIDIGSARVKFAVCSNNTVHRLVCADLPDNMVTGGRILSPQAMSEFLHDVRRENRLTTRDVALILPEQAVFFRTLTVPGMTADQLRINLPYEFRDYISSEKEKYFYDYAVVSRTDDENGVPTQFELQAAATPKALIAEYRDLLRRAGLRLRIAVPNEMAWSNLIRTFELRAPAEASREYCVLDIGHAATRLHLFHGRTLEMNKLIDYGCSLLDTAIAETRGVDEHVAHTHKHADHDDALNLPACQGVYNALAVEVMKALNFHAYEHRENLLQSVYYCGGGAQIEPLIAAIREAIDLPLEPITRLLPPLESDQAHALSCAAAIGATQQ